MQETSKLFDEITKEKSFQRRVSLLKDNRTPVLECLLILNFSSAKKKAILEEVPPLEFSDDKNRLLTQFISNFAYFWEDIPMTANATKTQRELKYIETLRSVTKEERELLISAMCRKLEKKYKNFTRKLVETAFPGLL